MKKNRQITLTEGSILKSLVALAVPIMASSFLNTVYSITDMAWIGMLGSKAVAGVGVGGMYIWLSQGLSSLARMGGQVNVAQAFGRGKKEEAAEYARAALQLVVMFGILFAVISVSFAEGLVSLFHLGDVRAVQYAESYLRITCGLIIFSYLTVVLTGIYTAQGDSRTPLLANVIGLVMNMVLDPVLILGIGPFPRMEVNGAAVATVLAQFVVMLVMILKAGGNKGENNVLEGLRIIKQSESKYYKGVFRIGTPTAIQGTVYCMISMVLARMAASFGPGAVAVQRVGGQVEAVSWNTADGFAAAINAFTAQNYGAGQIERVRKGYRISFWTTAVWGGLITLVFLCFPRPISQIFFYEADVIKESVGYLSIIGIGEAFMCVELMTVGALSGLGRTKLCSIISIILTSSRIPLALILSSTALGLKGIWWALTLSSIVKGALFTFAFRTVSGKRVILSR
ncbi:MAG: MATE family efflux transporter [Dorea sp.]|jgi:putative MATE family efflux protein|nr:MATE family efflux transporter [Dorea sp.]